MVRLNNQPSLYFYDHRPRKYNQERRTGYVGHLHVTRLMKEAQIRESVTNSEKDATHLIVHLDDSDRGKAVLGEWPESASVDQIVLCLTSENRFDSTEFPHLISTVNGHQRVTFFCRDAEPLRHADTFAAFCNLTTADAKRIADGELSPPDPNLRRIFFDISERYLSALTILCQAYLVLHASINPELARSLKEVNESLEAMGLWRALREFGEIPQPINPQEKYQMMTSQWWLTTLTSAESGEADEKARIVSAGIMSEWEGLRNVISGDKQRSQNDLSDVEVLMGSIGLKAGHEERSALRGQAKLDPVVVARAYRAIRSIMGAKK